VWLQGWYAAHCNGDWEHQNGIEIGTLDNPGGTFQVDLQDTDLRNVRMNLRSFIDRNTTGTSHVCKARSLMRHAGRSISAK
jgi:hypothetical protein